MKSFAEQCGIHDDAREAAAHHTARLIEASGLELVRIGWCGLHGVDAPDLAVQVDASNPALLLARLLGGEAPAVQIDGDAQLAGDVNWLLLNLRWDVAADLERLFGPVVAQQLHQVGRTLAAGMRTAIRTAAEIAERLRSRRA